MINSINKIPLSTFKAQSSQQKKTKTTTQYTQQEGNPISRKGEAAKGVLATFIAGIFVAGRLFVSLFEDGEWIPDLIDGFSDILAKSKSKPNQDTEKNLKEFLDEAKKNNKAWQNNRTLKSIGIFVSLIATGLCGFALLYTAFNAPKIAYNSKVDAYKKGREMDVYIQGNEAEKELYTQLDAQATNATAEEKEHLKENYLKMRNAKNQVPDFVKLQK